VVVGAKCDIYVLLKTLEKHCCGWAWARNLLKCNLQREQFTNVLDAANLYTTASKIEKYIYII